MFDIRLFPPQVLLDLNFCNVNSEKELASRLRAVQRVVAAAIGAYLYARYEPIFVAKLGGTLIAKFAVNIPISQGYFCLSNPSTCLFMQWFMGYRTGLNVFRKYENKQFISSAVSVGLLFANYVLGQVYKEEGVYPNFLEKLFQKVEDKVTLPLWDRFYKKE